MQIYGGHGYIRDNGMEQLVRDARITQIYEGANGIQALDLVGRKLGSAPGPLAAPLLPPGRGLHRGAPGGCQASAEFVLPLAKAFGRLQQATALARRAGPARPGGGGRRGERLSAPLRPGRARLHVVAAWPRPHCQKLADDGTEECHFYEAKLATARFFMARLLPQTGTLFATLMAGKKPLMALAEAAF